MKTKFDYIIDDGGKVYFQGIKMSPDLETYFKNKYVSKKAIKGFESFNEFIGEDISDKFGELKKKFEEEFIPELRRSVEKIKRIGNIDEPVTIPVANKVIVSGRRTILYEEEAVRIERIEGIQFNTEFDIVDGVVTNTNRLLDPATVRVHLEINSEAISLKETFLIFDEDFQDYYSENKVIVVKKGDIIPLWKFNNCIKEIKEITSKYLKYLEKKKASIPKDGIEVDI